MASLPVWSLIEKLGSSIYDELKRHNKLPQKVEEAKDQLLLIQAYLKDADAKAEAESSSSSTLKEWVKQVREAAFSLEDTLDLHLFQLEKYSPPKHHVVSVRAEVASASGGVGKSLAAVSATAQKVGAGMETAGHKVVSGGHTAVDAVRNVFKPDGDIASQIDKIMEKIRKLYEQRESLGLSIFDTLPHATLHDFRRGSRFLKDEELVGVEDTKKALTDWLMSGDPRLTVISLSGEGGLGKTTLASKVYDKHKKTPFECYTWIDVPRSFQVKDLLKTMLEELYKSDGQENSARVPEMGEHALNEKIREYLGKRSYMIVFDNVWKEDFFGAVKSALPTDSGERKKRIIITARDTKVAQFCKGHVDVVHTMELNPLSEVDGLELFRQKTFGPDGQIPGNLQDLSKSFVEKCDRVPLAIEAISCLLKTKGKDEFEWRKVRDSLSSRFSSEPNLQSYILVLSESYHDLHHHLKLCLLYFGLFPESCAVMRPRLIRLWVAEGFVNKNELRGDQTPEEVAEDYLAELISRSLVKVSEVDVDGLVIRCRVHDLMHSFIIEKCKDSNFCQVVGKDQEFKFHEWSRRLSIQNINEGVVIRKDKNYRRVQSCIACDTKLSAASALESLLSYFKLLVTLDFEDLPLDHLPEDVGDLLNLKYLSIRRTNIKTIPKFIGKLRKLETLDLRNTQVRELPVEINKLVKMRHLLSYSSYPVEEGGHVSEGVKLKEGIGSLTALQSLNAIDATIGEDFIREIENLKNMRVFGIVNLSEGNGKTVCNTIKKMPHLYWLLIKSTGEHGVLDLHTLVDPPPRLQLLSLDGRLERLPEWIPKLNHLVILRLKWSRLAEDPLPVLKDLPELLRLYLESSWEGGELHFKRGWFGKLKELRLRRFRCLRNLKIDGEDALPNLEELWLELCPQMVQVPDDIQNLVALKCVFLREMPNQFANDIATRLKEKSQTTKLYMLRNVLNTRT